MATVHDFLEKAKSYIGVTEKPVNRNPFAAIAKHADGQFWCATFVVACARQVGLKLPSESAAVKTMADAFKHAGRWYAKDPKPGDIVFFNFPGRSEFDHVGIVEAVDGKGIHTVEGNTSSSIEGSQTNGGGVFPKTRQSNFIVGYGRPAFDDEPPTQGLGTIVPEEELEMAAVIARPQGGYIVVQHDGGVLAYDDAPSCGDIPGDQREIRLGGNVIGGAWTESGNGYWLVARDGAVYAYGDAEYAGAFNAEPPEVRGSRYAVGMVRTGPKSYRIITFDPSADGSPYDGYEYG